MKGNQMQRRTFIQAALAALAAPYLPPSSAGAKIPDPKIWNAATLTAELNKMFACQAGPAAPFVDMVAGVATAIPIVEKKDQNFPNITVEAFGPVPEGGTRYRYETYACAIEGGDAKEAEARLAKHFYDEFSKLPTGQLVWRVTPQFASHDDIRWGVTYATRKQIEDGHYDLANLPKDAQYDIEWDSYRQVLRKTTLHRMRMRLVLPHLYDHKNETVALPNLLKPEGARIKKMI
jgi:hypothetical protein